jgi:uncharacterized membrane protein YfcA
MGELQTWQYMLIALGAVFVGLGKGGLPGVGNLTVVLLAVALPAKASVGVLLPILIAADVVAVSIYRRHALWPYILKLLPWMVVGIVIGYFVFSRVNDAHVKFLIGVILLSMTGVHFASGLPKYAYIGTSAWLFLLVNLIKVPFMMELGIIDFSSLGFSASFMPYALVAALIAPLIVKRINQRVFEILIWVFVVIGGLKLVL